MNDNIYSRAAAHQQGLTEGVGFGYYDGLRMGGSVQITGNLSAPAKKYQEKVLFIPCGMDYVNVGVEEALRSMMQHVIIADKTEQLEELTERHHPDWILIMNGILPGYQLQQIDDFRTRGFKFAVWFVDDPYYADVSLEIAPHYDVVLTQESSMLPYYHEKGIEQVHYLPLAFDPHKFRPMHVPMQYRSDICFIGRAFKPRMDLFDQITPILKRYHTVIIGEEWEGMKNYNQLKDAIQVKHIRDDEVAKYYNGAKILLNIHRGTNPEAAYPEDSNTRNIPGYSINPRTFDMTACGNLQLTDERSDLHRHYRIGEELDVYYNAQDLMNKIEHYMQNDRRRLEMGLRGMKRAFSEHTYLQRLHQVAAILGFRTL